MTARELFVVAIRLGGVLNWTWAFSDLVHVVYLLAGLPYPTHNGSAVDALSALAFFLGGLLLFVGAEPLARLAYGRKPNSN